MKRGLKRVLTLAILLALIVVGLGAYTRLTNAGLGCPDWPGCYGQLSLPSKGPDLERAQARYPEQRIEKTKAWTEMVHRYAAGGLVCLLLISLVLTLRARTQGNPISLMFPLFLLSWIVFQALLGMWTVTWKLLPIVVMAHLLSGAILFSGLVLFRFHLSNRFIFNLSSWRPWFAFGLMIVFIQMALGAWVSANYAGIACNGFPTCNGNWWPIHWETLKSALNVLRNPIGVNYQGGVLQHEVRVAIQVIHRWGAVLTAFYSVVLMGALWIKVQDCFWRAIASWTLFLLITQITLGIVNVLYYLPLSVAVMHNVVAVLILSTWAVMWYASTHSSDVVKESK
jgi:heme a synthase